MKNIASYIRVFFLARLMAKTFRKEMLKVLIRELKEPGYLDQENFDSIYSRAKYGVTDAMSRVIDLFAVSIGKHREKRHGEDHTEEIETSSVSLTSSEIKSASKGWWW